MAKRKSGLGLVLAGAILALGCSDRVKGEEKTVSSASGSTAAPTLQGLLAEKDVVLLDVRTLPEWQAGHIPGAVHLPLGDLQRAPGRATELLGASTRPVVAYCQSGARSGRAVGILKAQGFSRVINGGGVRGLAATMKVQLAK